MRSGNRILKVSVKADFWDNAGRLFFRIAASVMYIMVAIGSRTGVKHQSFYLFVLIGLCVSLVSDLFFAFNTGPPKKRGTFRGDNGFKDLAPAGFSFLAAAAFAYLIACFSYAAFSWYDAAIFILLLALCGAAIYNKDKMLFKRISSLLYTIILCAVAAKALSSLFLHNERYIYAVFAAAGVCLFSFSNILLIYGEYQGKRNKLNGAINTVMYYAGQALIALSVML